MRKLLISGLALIAFAGSARAQDAEDRIVVTGKKAPAGAVVRRQLREIMTTVDGQLARFSEPVCPVVQGLSPESNHAISDRIRETAQEAGAKVAEPNCAPNIIILIAANSDAITAALRKRYPRVFSGVRPGELRRALRDGPVHAWNTVEVRNEDGEPLSGSEGDAPPMLEVRTASRVTEPVQQVTVQSIVVIDAEAAAGKSLEQVAAFAAMRTLAGARPPSDAARADTIMSLFDKNADPPPSMTRLDSLFLEQLYAGPANRRANATIGRVQRDVRTGE